ncbi:MAG: SPFH domain-containing protein [Candidatus Cloacimonetes bacterium]|nr:SPFH domain-containing protein [Candidatus Cloacimonadota bacterium]
MIISKIIKFEGPTDVFIWKHPIVILTHQMQLYVENNYYAILFRDGEILDIFTSGHYTLNASTTPLLKKVLPHQLSRNVSFQCDVYFVNCFTSFNFLWGTPSPIPMQDPLYGLFVNVRANGQMKIKVSDSAKLVKRLAGDVSSFIHDKLQDYLRDMIMMKIVVGISQIMINDNVSFLDVSARLFDISEAIHISIARDLYECGLSAVYFNVNSITIPSSDYAQLKEAKETAVSIKTIADAEAYSIIAKGEAEKTVRPSVINIGNVASGGQVVVGDNYGNIVGADGIINRPSNSVIQGDERKKAKMNEGSLDSDLFEE